MLRHTFHFAVVATLAGALACSDRPPATAPGGTAAETLTPTPEVAPAPGPPEQLARALARALGAPQFRAYVKAQLDASPFREHKLQFQRFLGADRGRAVEALALDAGVAAADFAQQADRAIPLEMYLPVPEHRRAWNGGANVLVATALRDGDPPVAFDIHGNRQVLSADHPPATPVIALVPVETDFAAAPSPTICWECIIIWPTPPPPSPGLYMTKSHFVDDFEGWLKGSPEFEAHILGQKGTSDSLTDYQCAGEHAGGPYYFDQNSKDWSGRVMLFSSTQIANYNAAHPNQNFRVFFVEDDDTACEIKADKDIVGSFLKVVDGANGFLTAGNDSSNALVKAFKRARALYNLWASVTSLIKTNDELIGNAVEDDVVGTFYPGFNWIVKGSNNVTNGWVNLEMK